MQVTLLGTGTPIPGSYRDGTALAVTFDDEITVARWYRHLHVTAI